MARYTSLPPAPQSAHASAQVMHSHSSTKKGVETANCQKKKKTDLALLQGARGGCQRRRAPRVRLPQSQQSGSAAAKGAGTPADMAYFMEGAAAAAEEEGVLSWHRSATASILRRSFCVMSWPSSPPDGLRRRGTCSERELRAKSRSFLNQRRRKKEEEGELSAQGAEERSVLVVEEAEWDQLPPPLLVSCRELRSFSSRERAPLELRPQRRS